MSVSISHPRSGSVCARATTLVLALGASMVFLHAAPLSAQGVRPRAGDIAKPRQRELMERRVEERLNEIVRARLALSDEQFTQLRDLSRRAESDRRALRRDELATRGELRRQLLTAQPADESRISELLDQLPKIERRRIDMMEQEQRALSKFLAPSQRARYFALQDELRRNLDENQRRRMGNPAGDSTLGSSRRLMRPPARP